MKVVVDGHVLAYMYVMGIKEPDGHRAEIRRLGLQPDVVVVDDHLCSVNMR